MMRLMKIGSVAALTGMAMSVTCSAATVQNVSGTVLLNQGDGFKPVSGSSQVKVGDRVMARAGSSAEIVYADGCVAKVQPGAVATIQSASMIDLVEVSPCALANGGGPGGAGSAGSAGSAGAAGAAGASSYALEIGAAALVAGGAAALILKSASP